MKILVYTDGSDFSRSAIEKSCQIIASPEKTSVMIVSIYQEVVTLDAFAQSAEYAEKQVQAAHQQAEENAEQAAAVIRERFPNMNVTSQAIMGAADQILTETAKEWGADIIVVGSHGRGFLERMLVGSISDSLVHHAPCSVFVVRPTTP